MMAEIPHRAPYNPVSPRTSAATTSVSLRPQNLTPPAQAGTRVSTRLSTYSTTPTITPSIAPSHISSSPSLTPSEKASPLAQDIRQLSQGLARLDDARLQKQRYTTSEMKAEELSKLALGAKLERALARRMVGQDAVFTVKKVDKEMGL
ncbi:hypothetical protein EJ06DRAFT_511482 [Trichodelitschia bisporula]|uniref:Uncharacterized protein n=1 Tax=Trichodelitschia bisporula TaxID=703511 RepID=A0A6G1HTZ3_9PEZI|nr:hypothetical protein EJ06DRAFT_511482 [Trichodelitschia bisporula]